MTKFTPRNDNVLVLPDEAEKMKGKLYIPESALQRITRGTIVAVGPGYLLTDGTRSEMDLKEGMRVEFHAQPGHPVIELDDDDGPYCVFKEVEIIGIVEDEPAAEMVMPDEEEDADELAKVG